MLYHEESVMKIHGTVDMSEQNEVVVEESVAEWCPEPKYIKSRGQVKRDQIRRT